ncbi:hypothetical protein [Pseudoalteromonas luteoviolacea]|uniref:hypothetical protein n=1 Tax=Pseudoalteromonas luteoviolacea TaxID=43657 RepID=UPI001B368EFD|nr:hypothetical protein [Pseudoalteromonas luteoviolacea]MBQ4835629.1 hypothetical protein [Pseudoalteromonas luteoviolacea]
MMIKPSFFIFLLGIISFDSYATMDLQSYKRQALIDRQTPGRCVNPPHIIDYYHRIDFAQSHGLITSSAASWGRIAGFYPVIDVFDYTIVAVCSFGARPKLQQY